MPEEEADPVMEEANRRFDEGKYQEAIALYDKLIAERRLGAEPLFMKAECLSNLGRHAEAIPWYDKAIEVDDENALIWNGKGNAYYHMEDYAQARVCFECAYDVDPEEPDYLFSIIETAILIGDLGEAVTMAREALRSTDNPRDVVLAWGFSIVALFLDQKPLNALDTIDELVAYMRDKEFRFRVEQGDEAARAFSGVGYDFCGVEAVASKQAGGATGRILQVLVSYLKGEADVEQLAKVSDEESDAISLEDVLRVEPPAGGGPVMEEYPDFTAISDPGERGAIEQIEAIIERFDDGMGFQSFAFLFEEYDWNQDRGPAPFLEEIDNRFFVEILDGQVRRLSIDLDTLAAAAIPEGEKGTTATAATYARAGALLRFLHLEDVFVTAAKLGDIVTALRAAQFGKGKELALYVNVGLIPGVQENLIGLTKIDEASEIDEIPVDYQEQGKRVVGSLVWTATR